MNFINAKKVKSRKEKIDAKKVEKFISVFNSAIKTIYEEDYGVSLNTGFDKIPMLNYTEFEHAAKLTRKEGWLLTQHEDNYQTISYVLKKLNNP